MSFINVSPFHEFLSGMNFILQINVGVVKLTGIHGTGKTAMLQELVRTTRQEQQDIVAFWSVPASFQQIKDTIRQQLNLDPAVNFHDALVNHLLARPFEQRRLIVVIDNAELMDEETLLAVGHLRTIRHAGQHLVGLVLCGGPELDQIIRQPEHRLLAEEILLSYELSPLSLQQLPDFCRGCLAARGLDGLVLAADDYRQIMQKSGGLPGKAAELVETYWPEDPEISESSLDVGKITSVLPAVASVPRQDVSAPQTTAIPEHTTTVAEPLYFSPLRPTVVPEVTPVIAPDMSAEFLAPVANEAARDGGDSSGIAAEVAPESRLDFASGFTPQPSCDADDGGVAAIAPDMNAELAGKIFADDGVDTTQQQINGDTALSSEQVTDGPPQLQPQSASSADGDIAAAGNAAHDQSPADGMEPAASLVTLEPEAAPMLAPQLLTEVSASVVYPPLPVANLANPVDVPPDGARPSEPDSSSYVTSGPEANSVVATDAAAINVAGESNEEFAAYFPDAREIETASGELLDATYDVSPKPQEEVSFDFSSATPVEIALGLAPEPTVAAATDEPQQTAPIITPVTSSEVTLVAQPGPKGLRTVVGTLVFASIAVVALQIWKTGSAVDEAATPVVSLQPPAPAAPAQASGNGTVPSVSVQQFGQAPAAAPAPITGEVVPQPIGTAPLQPSVTEAVPAVRATAVAQTAQVAVPAGPASAAGIATVAQGVVSAWADAWARQDVDAYLAFYHADFVPPKGASREAWESSRDRVISSQSSIAIDVENFEVLDTVDDQTAVQFLLTYRGDNYADRTLKQLTLQPDTSGEARIVREENLRTEAFDPVIEAASSWMPDSPRVRAESASAGSQAASVQVAAAIANDANSPTPQDAAATSQQTPDEETIPLIFNLTTLTDREVGQVNGVLQAWAAAWQSKDTDAYLSHYHTDYKAPEAASVGEWRNQRIARISAANGISIELQELEILQNNDDNLLLELLLEYHTDTYGDRTLKRMMLSKSAQGQWLITMESNLEVQTL